MKCKPCFERLAKTGDVETGVQRGLRKVHKPWELEPKKQRTNRELGRGVYREVRTVN